VLQHHLPQKIVLKLLYPKNEKTLPQFLITDEYKFLIRTTKFIKTAKNAIKPTKTPTFILNTGFNNFHMRPFSLTYFLK